MMTDNRVSFDSISALKAFVGKPAVSGAAILVDQSMIDHFAEVTQDKQWIHVDPVRAAVDSPFKTTIAHGLLTLSLIPGWYNNCFTFPNRKMGLNYGFDKVRFTSPVPCGSKLIADFQLTKVEDVRENEVSCFWKITIKIEGADRPAAVADWLVRAVY